MNSAQSFATTAIGRLALAAALNGPTFENSTSRPDGEAAGSAKDASRTLPVQAALPQAAPANEGARKISATVTNGNRSVGMLSFSGITAA